MSGILMRQITAIAVASFVIVAGSGIAMFAGFENDFLKDIHEWLAIILILAIGLFLVRDWGSVIAYLRREKILVPATLAVIAAALIVIPAALSQHQGTVPTLLRSLEQAKLDDLARILKMPPDGVADVLEQRGFVVHSTDLTVSEIAADSDQHPKAALLAVLDAKR